MSMATTHDLDIRHHGDFLQRYAEAEPALRTYVRALLPDRADAADILQSVAVALWQKFSDFDPSRDFRRWAFGVARIETLKLRRDIARDRHVFDDELVGRLADSAEHAAPRHVSQREALDSCLQKLPEAQRHLVLAAYARDVRIDELAARRGQTSMSLYKVLQRIRRTLLECVQRTMAREENP